ncbi:flagellar export protein FliJ [Desulfogranum marinum]|uniref:flagellar export protein FliJ n=1 Tax=Desulfogranum marinum TaxID=453220 RepID=UPI001962D902|nr:flagellar export protein FliJ [Desulfogranum marinum]MBM9513188.1 flagellar export protein FliJ [Desulfogranum marinum]
MQPFKLDAVIKFRKQLEDTARQNLFTALEKETEAQAVRTRHQQDRDHLYLRLQQEKEQGTTAPRLIMLENRIALVKEQVSAADQGVQKAEREVESKRKALLKASQDRKVIEKMKEKQNNAYQEHLNKKELAMLDELAVLFHKK